jgi:protein-S-isoprenylcysteine O-methyltransferase Ste14
MLPLTAIAAIYALWVLFSVSWALAALWSSGAQGRPGLGAQLGYILLNGTGAILLFLAGPLPVRHHLGRLRRLIAAIPGATPLWTLPPWAGWALVGLAAAGFAFAWWARLHLGALWSSTITRKADHRIVDTGPYGRVRHPIYTGLIAAAFALAAIKASPAAILGAALITAGWWLKARTEEAFLRQGLSPEARGAYDAYRTRVPMLVPRLGLAAARRK